jgi:hypothetical protein
VALDRGVLAYVTVDSTAWMGDSAEAFAAPPEIQEAHVIAGSASMLVKVRTATTEQLAPGRTAAPVRDRRGWRNACDGRPGDLVRAPRARWLASMHDY